MKEIAKDVFHIPVMPRNSINCYLIEDVLVDAGIRSSYKVLNRALKDKVISAHALTHAHADHQGSSASICKAYKVPFWCSEQEKPRAESGDATREYPAQRHLVTKFQKKYWTGQGYPVARTLQEGDKVGGFTVIETPGHSSGHLSYFREHDGVLIVGDVLTNMNLLSTLPGLHQPPGLFTMDAELNKMSILKLAALDPAVLCFGHGPVLREKGALTKFIRHMF